MKITKVAAILFFVAAAISFAVAGIALFDSSEFSGYSKIAMGAIDIALGVCMLVMAKKEKANMTEKKSEDEEKKDE